jgi:hypothetical protein
MTVFDGSLTSFYMQDELAKVTRKTATANPMQTHGKKLQLHLKMQTCNLS